MNNSSIDETENIDQAIKLNREIASRIANLKRKCFDYRVIGPIELSQRSHRSNVPSTNTQSINNILKFTPQEQQLIIKELSCRLNIQGLTVEQFLTGRTEITEHELIVILINKLKYPNQFSAMRTARFIFQMTIYDTDEKRQIDDILHEFKTKLDCSSYSRSTGKELFEKTALKIRNTFYHKIMNKKQVDYHMIAQFLYSQSFDAYQINQLLSYVIESSPSTNFHSIELKPLLIKDQQTQHKKDKYEKKQSILTKSSEDRDRESSGFGTGQQINFSDCQIQIVEEHEFHKCGIYNCH